MCTQNTKDYLTVYEQCKNYRIWGSHGVVYEDVWLMDCNAV